MSATSTDLVVPATIGEYANRLSKFIIPIFELFFKTKTPPELSPITSTLPSPSISLAFMLLQIASKMFLNVAKLIFPGVDVFLQIE